MNDRRIEEILDFIRMLYPSETPIPLHAPRFLGNEKKYLIECIDSTYVSYVGRFVTEFEEHIKKATKANHAVAIVNGTAALQMMIMAVGIKPGEEIITQALTFAASAAGIKHAGAEPAFIDVDRDTMGMSPSSLKSFLSCNVERLVDGLYDKGNGRRIAAVMPMHTFGHPARIAEISAICEEEGLMLLEDAAESLGSTVGDRHTGLFGKAAILSFNGNKPVTTGGGGMVITNDETLAARVRHISTTAKRKHPWEFYHDEVGYNLRLPNVNAALGCAQMERLGAILSDKRSTAALYKNFFQSFGLHFQTEPEGTKSNYWLNSVLFDDKGDKNLFLEYSNGHGVQTRPVWTLMNKLPPYAICSRSELPIAEWLEDRIVNLPSSVRTLPDCKL